MTAQQPEAWAVVGAGHLRYLAAKYLPLHDLLDPATRPRSTTPGGGRVAPVDAPIPLRVEISDVITEVAILAHMVEGHARAALGYGAPYWTRPRRAAVPAAYRWTADVLPEIPEEITRHIAAQAAPLRFLVCRLITPGPALITVAAPCPACGLASLRRFVEDDAVRCINPACRTPEGQRRSWSVTEWQDLHNPPADDAEEHTPEPARAG